MSNLIKTEILDTDEEDQCFEIEYEIDGKFYYLYFIIIDFDLFY